LVGQGEERKRGRKIETVKQMRKKGRGAKMRIVRRKEKRAGLEEQQIWK
jgi:hypothetical protein